MAQARKPAKKAPKLGRMRPALLAAGLGLFWFVEYQDFGGEVEAPMWGYLILQGARVLADFVGAWFVVSALHLALALSRYGFGYLRTLWPQASR